MSLGFFITGTDTGVGKTWASIALMRYFKRQRLSVVGMKPVAAGCEWVEGELKNDDALLLQQHSSMVLPYATINPYALARPVSPHLAAEQQEVQLPVIVERFVALTKQADVVVVEGAGGWLVPLSKTVDIADLARALRIPVIVVVGIRLGCINHARLTLQAIQAANIPCAGWLAMCIEPDMLLQAENIATLQAKIHVPLLGVLPYCVGEHFDCFDYLADNIKILL